MKSASTPPPPPLARFERVHTTEVDEARTAVGEAFCPHHLIPLHGTGQVDARLHSARAGHIGLHYLDYGSSVRIAPGELSTFYLIQIPLAGKAEVRCGGDRIVSDPGMASVPAPDHLLEMRWSEHNPQLIVRIERLRLEDHLSRMLGRPLSEPIRFDLGMDLTDPGIRSWRRVVDLLVDEVDGDGEIQNEPIAMSEVERLLLSRLVLAQPNNYSGLLHRRPPRVASRPIRHAAELIQAHASEPLCVEDVAEAVGLSVRALQEGFRRHLDTTPMNYVREVRLQRAHDDLVAADPTRDSVTDIALRWGFLHAGRFSVLYRERFGEPPSVTLRR
ncbi:AraC family transcriptional regulator [Actinocorallia sp. B10E7]|uniref:AraC family transcriptional regulator n=1 Tax=Actinocorallia sp. B10E7 TaxID=3153558 RepID=UPI00325E315D